MKKYEMFEVKDERPNNKPDEERTLKMEARRMEDDEKVQAHRCILIKKGGKNIVLGAPQTNGATVAEAMAFWNNGTPENETVGIAILKNYDEQD